MIVLFNATFNNISVISWRFLYRNVGHFRKFIYAIFDSYLIHIWVRRSITGLVWQ